MQVKLQLKTLHEKHSINSFKLLYQASCASHLQLLKKFVFQRDNKVTKFGDSWRLLLRECLRMEHERHLTCDKNGSQIVLILGWDLSDCSEAVGFVFHHIINV